MVVEPGLVSKKDFNGIVDCIKKYGFEEYNELKIPLSKGMVLKPEFKKQVQRRPDKVF